MPDNQFPSLPRAAASLLMGPELDKAESQELTVCDHPALRLTWTSRVLHEIHGENQNVSWFIEKADLLIVQDGDILGIVFCLADLPVPDKDGQPTPFDKFVEQIFSTFTVVP